MGQNHSFLSNTKNIKGIGSGCGYDHWKKQRITAVALFFLYSWFLYTIYIFFKEPYQTAAQIIYSPFNLVIFLSLITVSIYHGCLGIKVICEDYISSEFLRSMVLIVVYFFSTITVCTALLMLVANFIINI
jgi:succinate dehydrogenase / fumarate reductase membrane anchor subunit